MPRCEFSLPPSDGEYLDMHHPDWEASKYGAANWLRRRVRARPAGRACRCSSRPARPSRYGDESPAAIPAIDAKWLLWEGLGGVPLSRYSAR